MKTIKVIRAHPKGGRRREVGEVYDAPEKFADLMVILGKAEYAEFIQHEPIAEPKEQGQKTADGVAEEAARLGVDLSAIEGTGKDGKILKRDLREYQTRMMKAG